MSNEKIKQSSIYLEDDLKTALKLAVIHNPEWRNVSDFIREACWEKLERIGGGYDKDVIRKIEADQAERQAKIDDYFKSRDGEK